MQSTRAAVAALVVAGTLAFAACGLLPTEFHPSDGLERYRYRPYGDTVRTLYVRRVRPDSQWVRWYATGVTCAGFVPDTASIRWYVTVPIDTASRTLALWHPAHNIVVFMRPDSGTIAHEGLHDALDRAGWERPNDYSTLDIDAKRRVDHPLAWTDPLGVTHPDLFYSRCTWGG